jgi:hypothetical protein
MQTGFDCTSSEFLRRFPGALDWAAVAIIGVVALPMSILRADFRRVHQYFTDPPRRQPVTMGEQTPPGLWLMSGVGSGNSGHLFPEILATSAS